jgi:hypothetical protein
MNQQEIETLPLKEKRRIFENNFRAKNEKMERQMKIFIIGFILFMTSDCVFLEIFVRNHCIIYTFSVFLEFIKKMNFSISSTVIRLCSFIL